MYDRAPLTDNDAAATATVTDAFLGVLGPDRGDPASAPDGQ